MVSFTFSTAIMALPLLASVASAKCSGRHSSSHRRHHAKIASAAQASASATATAVALPSGSQNAVQLNYGKPSAADPSALSSIWASPTSSGPQPTATSDVNAGEFPGISKNGIGFGFLPDYKTQTLSQIDEGLGIKSSFYGWYAQLPQSGEWDGGQLLSIIDDVKKTGAIFQPAVMPNSNNWNGLTPDNNYQALAIARVMEKFTSQGIEVWLRFAHEVNWYQTDGTYSGGVNDFKQGWAAVAAAVKGNPLVKMFYTPNIASGTDQYEQYFPDDKSTVDIIGIDYYPRSSSESFLEHVKPWYDMHCQDGSILFAMGETGTMWDANAEEKLAWVDQLTNAETANAMPNYVGATWFNYDKEQQFELYKAGATWDNEQTVKFLSSGTVASGARMGGGTSS